MSRVPTQLARLTQPIRKSSSASPAKALQERVQQIKDACADPYPRLAADQRTVSCAEIRSRYSELADNDTVEDTVVVSGRFSLAFPMPVYLD